MTPDRHGGTVDVPAEALLADDWELALVWAPLYEDGEPSPECAECGEAEEECTCGE